MSREILFRGKRSDNGEWCYGDLIHNGFDGTSRTLQTGIAAHGCYPLEVTPETIGQFTGLTDSKGNKVFEGDILIYIATNMSDMEVKFENGCFVGEGPFNTHPLSTYLNSGDFESIEVSGNIHDK